MMSRKMKFAIHDGWFYKETLFHLKTSSVIKLFIIITSIFLPQRVMVMICWISCILQGQENGNLKWSRALGRTFTSAVLCTVIYTSMHYEFFPVAIVEKQIDLTHPHRRVITWPWVVSSYDIAFELYHICTYIHTTYTCTHVCMYLW